MRLDNNGNPYSLDSLAQEIIRSRPKLGVEESRSGTGTKFGFNKAQGFGSGSEMPDAATDPEGYKAWKQANGHTVRGNKSVSVTVTPRSGRF